MVEHTEVPAFEMRFPHAPESPILIYASGRPVVGVSSGHLIINRIPLLIAQAEERAEARVRRGLLAVAVMSMSLGFAIIAAVQALKWLAGPTQ